MTQDSAVSQQLNIRGVVSVKLNDASAEPSVGLFVDEVYLPRMGSAFTDFFDLERIEVIRGPQGVLLGKNVVGGALSVITAKPSFTTSGSATVSYGNFDSFMANGYLTGGLTRPRRGSFAFQVRDRAGYNRNILLHRDLDDLQSYQGARGVALTRSRTATCADSSRSITAATKATVRSAQRSTIRPSQARRRSARTARRTGSTHART